MFRTRFKKEIVAEFLPPTRRRKQERVIVLCDGIPGIPRKKNLVQFLAGKGYWVFYPRYRGAWESDGEFLARSPHEDILDVINELPKGVTEVAFGKKFELSPEEVFVIGGSFGGAAAILCSLDSRVKRVIANCPVVDWSIARDSEKAETNKDYVTYLRQAFGNAYRMPAHNWRKLYSGRFFNPMHHVHEIDASKILMFHAKDDPHVPAWSVESFAKKTDVKLKLLARGGHLKTEFIVQKYWKEIEKFFVEQP
ncbi:MAG: alpha/beta hydrolase family protein [Terriglobales bacterium]